MGHPWDAESRDQIQVRRDRRFLRLRTVYRYARETVFFRNVPGAVHIVAVRDRTQIPTLKKMIRKAIGLRYFLRASLLKTPIDSVIGIHSKHEARFKLPA